MLGVAFFFLVLEEFSIFPGVLFFPWFFGLAFKPPMTSFMVGEGGRMGGNDSPSPPEGPSIKGSFG